MGSSNEGQVNVTVTVAAVIIGGIAILGSKIYNECINDKKENYTLD